MQSLPRDTQTPPKSLSLEYYGQQYEKMHSESNSTKLDYSPAALCFKMSLKTAKNSLS